MGDSKFIDILHVKSEDEKQQFLALNQHLSPQKTETAIKKMNRQIEKHNKLQDAFATMRNFDRTYGYALEDIIGVDEAGRGPLAGPVVAAAVVLSAHSKILGIDDSKKLNEKQRESLFDVIINESLSYGVGIVEPDEIDSINILEATKKAMSIAIKQVEGKCILIDAVQLRGEASPVFGIIKGDEKSYAIAAASIIAKVTRDRMMLGYHVDYPEYGFNAHKGYGTTNHYKALDTYGASPIHRKSFLRKWSEAIENKR